MRRGIRWCSNLGLPLLILISQVFHNSFHCFLWCHRKRVCNNERRKKWNILISMKNIRLKKKLYILIILRPKNGCWIENMIENLFCASAALGFQLFPPWQPIKEGQYKGCI
ncbi:hypothetical protein V6Z11_A07G123100 [Gossypium hirsutum]